MLAAVLHGHWGQLSAEEANKTAHPLEGNRTLPDPSACRRSPVMNWAIKTQRHPIVDACRGPWGSALVSAFKSLRLISRKEICVQHSILMKSGTCVRISRRNETRYASGCCGLLL